MVTELPLIDHVENVHLKLLPADEEVNCNHPVCKSESLVFNDVNHFKNHIARVHGISLRELRYVG
jgi:hypothetical protein